MAKIFTSSPTVYKNLGEDLVGILSDGTDEQVEDNIKKLLQGKYSTGAIKQLNNIRSVVDNIIPTALFVSISDVENELYKYTKVTQPGILAEGKTIGGARAPAAQEAYQRNDEEDTLKFTKELASAVKRGVEEFSKSSIVQKIPYDILIQNLTTSGQLLGLAKTLGRNRCYRLLQPITNSSNLTTFGAGIDYVFVFSDFSTAGKIQEYVSPEIEKVIKEWGSSLLSKKVGLKSLLDLGHAIAKTPSTETTEQEMLLNFPKLAQVILDRVLDIALNGSGVLPPVDVISVEQETANFIKATYQVENFVEVTKDFSEGFLQIFVALGGQVLKFENSVINQYRGSAFEGITYKGSSQVEVAVKLKQYLESVRNQLIKDAKTNRVDTVIASITGIASAAIINKSSPSLIDYIELTINNIFSGKNTSPFSQKKPTQKITKPNLVVSSTRKNKASPKTKIIKLKSAKKTISLPATITRSTVDLPMLMMQINRALHDQIKRNMGDGSRKDVLNYRTGRFAQSAKVEKLSESRQGMITAFYSYMKNPYATFSRGGRQERPYTRDPKLLISKSIRELAGQQVANRMRAVLV